MRVAVPVFAALLLLTFVACGDAQTGATVETPLPFPAASAQSPTQSTASPESPVSAPTTTSSAGITVQVVSVPSPTSTRTAASAHMPTPVPTDTVVPTNTPTPDAVTHRTLGYEFGAAYASGGADAVLRINGYDIANVELAAYRSGYNNQVWSIRDMIARAAPGDEVTATSIDDQYRGPLSRNIVEQYGQVPGCGVRVRHPDWTAQAAVDCVSGASCSASCFVVTPGVR